MRDRSEREQELGALAARLGVEFANLDLLDEALTHASLTSEEEDVTRNYESLEFLGDAALSLAVAHYLFEHAPGRSPGDYSRMRAAVVNKRCLARLARQLDIAPAIRLGKGEELSGGRKRTALLEDCLEATIGAIYLDQGWDAAREFVERTFAEELRRAQNKDRQWDFKSRLQHYCQARQMPLPKFVVVRSEGPDHRKEFEIEVLLQGRPCGRGTGLSKKEAEQNAARAALAHERQNEAEEGK